MVEDIKGFFDELSLRQPVEVWRTIETYPPDPDLSTGCMWGPEAFLLCPVSNSYPYGPTVFVGHLEADMWLTRCGSDPTAWDELHTAPTHWAPLPLELPVGIDPRAILVGASQAGRKDGGSSLQKGQPNG